MNETTGHPGLKSPTHVDISDEELLVRYRDRGDVAAFEVLVHRYENPMYNYLRRYLRNGSLAADVFQMTFLRVHEKCRQFQEDRRFRPWLYSIATHQAIDALRKEARRPSISLDQQHSLNDADVGTLYAEAMMVQRPWKLYSAEGEPEGDTPKIVAKKSDGTEIPVKVYVDKDSMASWDIYHSPPGASEEILAPHAIVIIRDVEAHCMHLRPQFFQRENINWA